MKKRLGRPIKENKDLYVPLQINFNLNTIGYLDKMVGDSCMSRTGIVRVSVDYLYYVVNGLEIPDDLADAIRELLKNNLLKNNKTNDEK